MVLFFIMNIVKNMKKQENNFNISFKAINYINNV